VPDQPDNVVQPFVQQRTGLYAAADYVRRHGLPSGPEQFGAHFFVGHDNENARPPFFQWLTDKVPREALTFRTNDPCAMEEAVLTGAGIGFIPERVARGHPGLIQVMQPLPDWSTSTWLVTHVDLHRTNKVQSFLTFLKQRAKDWIL